LFETEATIISVVIKLTCERLLSLQNWKKRSSSWRRKERVFCSTSWL